MPFLGLGIPVCRNSGNGCWVVDGLSNTTGRFFFHVKVFSLSAAIAMPPRQPVGAGQYGDGLASVVDVVRKEGMKAKGPKKERPKKKKIYKCVAAILPRP